MTDFDKIVKINKTDCPSSFFVNPSKHQWNILKIINIIRAT